jgi:hypothetical protein
MASFRKSRRGTKKWLARRNRQRIEFFLGYYYCEEDALEAERKFDLAFPPGVKLP